MNHFWRLSSGSFSSSGGMSMAPAGGPDKRGALSSDSEWDEIGKRIAFAGGIYPLALGAGLLLLTVAYWGLNGPPATATVGATLVMQLAVVLIVGLPFLAFVSFMLSTLATVLMVSTMAWMGRIFQLEIVPGCVRLFSGAAIAMLWVGLLLVVAGR